MTNVSDHDILISIFQTIWREGGRQERALKSVRGQWIDGTTDLINLINNGYGAGQGSGQWEKSVNFEPFLWIKKNCTTKCAVVKVECNSREGIKSLNLVSTWECMNLCGEWIGFVHHNYQCIAFIAIATVPQLWLWSNYQCIAFIAIATVPQLWLWS